MSGFRDDRDPKDASPPSGGESFASLFESTGSRGRQRRFRRGERVEVEIVALGRDSIFADLGDKQEGYFDRTEFLDPSGKLTIEVGARVAAVVADVDGGTGQVRLAPVFVRRAASEEPGGAPLEERIPITKSGPLLVEGARVRGTVTGVERYGVFVQITGTQGRGGRGLIPTAETGTPRGADLRKLFPVGQEVEAKIVHIDEQGKIRLSVSALKADEERGDYASYLAGQEPGEGAEAAPKGPKKGKAPAAKPAPRNFGTLGDLFAKTKR